MSPTAAPFTREDETRALAPPFRAILLIMLASAGAVQVVDFAAGQYLRGAMSVLLFAVVLGGWLLQRRGATEQAAILVFYTLALSLTVRVWLGYGLHDFAIAAYPAILFLGCVFLPARAYWGLSALVLVAATAIGVAEITGVRAGMPGTIVTPARLINLLIILAGTAVGGRALTYAVRSGVRREHALSGALRTTEERLEKIFQASHNAIVVSRLHDGSYLDVNDAYLRLFGHAREDVLGRSALDVGIWEDPRERERFVRDVRRHGYVRGFATRLLTRTGNSVEAEISAERIELEGEEWLMASVADVTALRVAERRAEYLATRDPLTGLPGREMAIERLRGAIERSQGTTRALGLLHIGIDRLTAVNESLGRAAGDDVLREAARRIEGLLRNDDTLSRLSGDELLFMADSLRSASDVHVFAMQLLTAFEPPFHVAGRELRVSASIGVCAFPDDGLDADALLRFAETAMRAAKEQGRGRYRIFDRSMTDRARDRLLVEGALREALVAGGLRLVYQPKIDLGTGEVAGLEALCRWRHPERGEVPSTQFIPIAEESDLILELGAWVLEAACAQLEQWKREGRRLVPVAVNLSARQLDARLPLVVSECLRRHEIDPQLLELEVTESMLIAHPEATRRVLQQLNARGSTIMLDDFGTGYSSLGYVKHLPLDGIKIDRAFVSGVATDQHDAAIVRAIVGLAHGLGFRVIAEGIENEQQGAVLRAVGCDEGQGFHFSHPLPPEEIADRFLRLPAALAASAD